MTAWDAQYREAIAAWSVGRDEESLERAYELGRAAMEAGLGVLDILAVHQAVAPHEGGAFLAECLAPFEMVLRGYREANAALAEVNATLEARVAERTSALRVAEERYRTLIEQLPGVVWRRDAAEPWALRYASPQVASMLGFTPDQWARRALADCVHEHDRERVLAGLRRACESGHPFQSEYRLQAREGVVWVRDEARLYRDPEGQPQYLQGILVDVTEEKLLEEQLREAQRAESVGRLAGGIAHDFNNLLTVILSYTELLIRRLPEADTTRRDLEEVKRAGQRAAALTTQLLAYSRRQILETRLVRLDGLIGAMGGMLRRVIGEDIDLVTELAPDLAAVRVDPGQLEQVLVNLVVNARDAMPHGGTLRVTTREQEVADEDARGLGLTPGSYVVVSVEDTGTGMTAEVRERVFEPFFTTKERDKGTGLGLATSYGIVKQSGGALSVQSAPGEGATFEVWLPAACGEPAPEVQAAPAATHASGAETVLLVEDEPAVRRVTARILAEGGYDVLQASDGVEAIALSASYEGPIHLLLSDVIMPGMNGKVLAERLIAARPALRVLFASGYDEESVARGLLASDLPLMQKPVAPDALLQRVREVLDN